MRMGEKSAFCSTIAGAVSVIGIRAGIIITVIVASVP